jgi:2,3-bisphosphoglycerate-independent phosphoglycerate mutase
MFFKKKSKHLPLILVILDGWGIAPSSRGNAITIANTPNIDELSFGYPFVKVQAHGEAVGLPKDQVGNSEAGHMNIGAGRVVVQDSVKITQSIHDGTFFKNAAFSHAINHLKKNRSRLHLMGMLSNGMSPHSAPEHLNALLELARREKVKEVYLHLFTDGRDSPKYVGLKLLEDLERNVLKREKIATVCGRFYGMDRKKAWDRTEATYNALVSGVQCAKAASGSRAITEAYNRGENDEFMAPCAITENGKILPRIANGDSMIFFNLRSDRARQLTKVFVQHDFEKDNPLSFKRKAILKNAAFIALTDFGPNLENTLTAYPSEEITYTLPFCLKNLSQLYIAEAEKFPHVTYFFNGGYSSPQCGEDRIEVLSPDVVSYDATPAMSTSNLADIIVSNAKKHKYDFTVLNIAAPDMIGHTGNLKAGIECCEAVDREVGRIKEAYFKEGGTLVITGDHGNVEEMINLETGEIDTEHSTYPVPLIIAGKKIGKKIELSTGGKLGDIAPTLLELLDIEKPALMTGRSLIIRK